MILFQSDWQKYPDAIPDMQTKNTSWVKLAALYKSMGVKNYYFHLALHQPALQGVDPYAKDLTLEQKAMILLECKFNPWYFFREIIRLPIPGGKSTLFNANRGIIAMFWCFFCGIDIGLVMPRQTGKSVGSDCLKLWLMFYYLKDAEIFLYTKDSGLRAKNIKKIKDIANELPSWLNPTTKKDSDNTEVITCKKLNNIMWSAIGQPSTEGAIKVGRGFTIPITFADEVAFIPNVQISLPALLASGGYVRAQAKLRGELYGNIFTTTAGKKDTTEGKFAYSLINDGMYWNESLLDCTSKEEVHAVVRLHSKGLGYNINGTFNHRQLGYTDQWLMDMISESRSDKDAADRDYLNIWTSGTESSPLSTQLNQVIGNSIIDPLYTNVSKEMYHMNWYIPERDIEKRMREGWIAIGLDSSNAVGRDDNALVFTDIRDMSVIATSGISEANLHRYAMWLAMLMVRYERTTLIIENKSSAQSILDTVAVVLLKYGINPFKRIYNTVVDNHTTRENDYRRISSKEGFMEETYLSMKGQFGFMTTGSRRALLYDTVLQEAAKSTGHLIKDRKLGTQILGLVLKNGRVDHVAGGHDDSVIAWLLCHWFIKHTKNLAFYGIDPRDCLSMVSAEGAILTPAQLEDKKRLAVLNMEIGELKDKLISAPDIIESKKYEKLLAWKVNEAMQLGETAYTMDSILDDVKNNKVTRRSLRDGIAKLQQRRGYSTGY